MMHYVSWLSRWDAPSQTHVVGENLRTRCGRRIPDDCRVKRMTTHRHGLMCALCLRCIGELKIERQGGGARTPQTPTMRMEP